MLGGGGPPGAILDGQHSNLYASTQLARDSTMNGNAHDGV
jgi:hypothetical protein